MKLLRSVAASRRGIYYVDALIAGLPCSAWISLTEETYSFTGFGYVFNGWPDGQSTMEQEQCVVDILKIILGELLKGKQDGKT